MNEARLKKAFENALKITVNEINNVIEFNSIKNWDSIGHMELIVSIEQEFDIIIDDDDVMDLTSFAKAKEILSSYGIDFSA